MLSHLEDSENAKDESSLPYVKILLHVRLLYNSRVEVRFALMGQMKPVEDLHKSRDGWRWGVPRSES
jgi:hypothetical protein